MQNKSFLTKIELVGFKSFGKDQSVDLKPINIIIGANGAGKSNFISFFKMLNYMVTGGFQSYVATSGFSENLLFNGSKKTPIIKAHLFFRNDRFRNEYIFTLVKSIEDRLIFAEETMLSGKQSFELSGGQKESYFYTKYLEHANEKALKTILSKCKAFQFHDTSESSHIRNSASLKDNNNLSSDGGNIAYFLYNLKTSSEINKKYYNRIVEYVRLVVPMFEDFVLEPSVFNLNQIQLRWKGKNNPDYVFNANQLSDGSIRFIALASLLLQPPNFLPNVILIDEPELGLHPQAIDLLGTMINIASQHAQIVVATQSPRLLDSFNTDQIIVADSDTDNCTILRRLNENELSHWLEDYSLSQLWEKNVLGGQP
ncbi:MAG: AAA family ATPase [Spirochaetia bacterium]|nr:AAA family ATPase [Spirochaetia bacterium]